MEAPARINVLNQSDLFFNTSNKIVWDNIIGQCPKNSFLNVLKLL